MKPKTKKAIIALVSGVVVAGGLLVGVAVSPELEGAILVLLHAVLSVL